MRCSCLFLHCQRINSTTTAVLSLGETGFSERASSWLAYYVLEGPVEGRSETKSKQARDRRHPFVLVGTKIFTFGYSAVTPPHQKQTRTFACFLLRLGPCGAVLLGSGGGATGISGDHELFQKETSLLLIRTCSKEQCFKWSEEENGVICEGCSR